MATIRAIRRLSAPAAELDRFLPAASDPVQEAMPIQEALAEAEMGRAAFPRRHRFYISASAQSCDPHSTNPSPTSMLQTVSQLEQTLRARRFAITTELIPPVSFDSDDLLHKARPLKGLADAVNVTDGASARAHMSALAAAALLA